MVDRLSKADQNQSVLLEIANSVLLSEEEKKKQLILDSVEVMEVLL